MQVGSVLSAEEKALVEQATAKLLGEFYIGQRVRFKHAASSDSTAYGEGTGIIQSFGQEGGRRTAFISFDRRPGRPPILRQIYFWALIPV